MARPDDTFNRHRVITEEAVQELDDPDSAEEGEVFWVYNSAMNDLSFAQEEDGTYFQRVCRLEDGTEAGYPLGDRECLEMPGGCVDDCGERGEGWGDICGVDGTFLFDAIDPEQMTEMVVNDWLEERIDDPQPAFGPNLIDRGNWGITADAVTIVNFDTYLGVTGTETADELSDEIAVPGIELVITAERGSFWWDMGDGSPLKECPEGGDSWVDQDPAATDWAAVGANPDNCSHTYTQPTANESGQVFDGNVAVEWIGIYTGTIDGAPVVEEHPVIAEHDFTIGVAESQAVVTR